MVTEGWVINLSERRITGQVHNGPNRATSKLFQGRQLADSMEGVGARLSCSGPSLPSRIP